jgi:hypothetical protein
MPGKTKPCSRGKAGQALCRFVPHHDRAAGELEGIDVLGSTTVAMADGQSKTVEVKRLHFGPPPPNRPTLATEVRARMDQAVPEPNP